VNLYRVGQTVLNIDLINGIVDNLVPADPGANDGRTVLRVFFEQSYIDLTGREAEAFRYWFRHSARCLDLHRDPDGEELISPHDQVRKAFEILRDHIDRERPRDREMGRIVHRLEHILDQFLTGELQPARSREFEMTFEV
jgi:hypothetical protein